MNTQYNDPKGAAGAIKVPLGLIPPHAMEQTAWVHKLGAEKYGRKVPVFACSKGEELEEFCTCGHSTLNQHAIQNAHTQLEGSVSSVTTKNTQKAKKPNATQGELFGLKDSVNPVTINTLEKLIQNIKNNKKQQQTLGFPQTKSMSKNKPLNEIDDQRYGIGITHVTEKELFFLSDLISKMKSEYLKNKTMGAQFVVGQQEEGVYSTSTTTTPPEDSEVLFATDATKDLACSETILRLLKKHLPTCAVQNLIVRDGEVEQYGAYNWRRTGVCASTYVNAILRHLNAWRDGEDLDPESGISHLAHVACSANILMDAGYCGKLQDDRNTTRQCNEVEEAEDGTIYRILKEGELVQDGDEILYGDYIWCPISTEGSYFIRDSKIFRRKVEDKAQKHVSSDISYEDDWGPLDEEQNEYRILEKGDTVEEGDEHRFIDDWYPAPKEVIGALVSGMVEWRRKITDCDLKDEVADCDLKETCDSKPEPQEECKCGRRYVYHWVYGWICEDCDLKHDDYYP